MTANLSLGVKKELAAPRFSFCQCDAVMASSTKESIRGLPKILPWALPLGERCGDVAPMLASMLDEVVQELGGLGMEITVGSVLSSTRHNPVRGADQSRPPVSALWMGG